MKALKVSVFLSAVMALLLAMILFAGHTNLKDENLKEKVLKRSLSLDHFSSDVFSSAGSSSILNAYEFCQKNKFDKALQLLEEADASIQNHPTAKFIQAICYNRQKQLNTAESLLLQLSESGHPFLQDQVNWCLAVLYLQSNKVDEAQPYLEILAGQPNADFHIEACKLMVELGLKPTEIASL